MKAEGAIFRQHVSAACEPVLTPNLIMPEARTYKANCGVRM